MAKSITEWDTKFGQRLQILREAHRVTQRQMADDCGLSKNYVSALERGINKCSAQTAYKYCIRLMISPDELYQYPKSYTLIPEMEILLKNMDKETQKRAAYLIKALL